MLMYGEHLKGQEGCSGKRISVLWVAEHQELEQEGEASVIHKDVFLSICTISTFLSYGTDKLLMMYSVRMHKNIVKLLSRTGAQHPNKVTP